MSVGRAVGRSLMAVGWFVAKPAEGCRSRFDRFGVGRGGSSVDRPLALRLMRPEGSLSRGVDGRRLCGVVGAADGPRS